MQNLGLFFSVTKVKFCAMMKYHLREPFELFVKEHPEVCTREMHTHSFFEIVYIVYGTGKQTINGTETDYKPNNLFLIAPDDSHEVRVDTPSKLFFIRFNHLFLQSMKTNEESFVRIKTALTNSRNEPCCVIKCEQDKSTIKSLMEMLMREHLNDGIYHNELILQFINTLLVIIARNVTHSFTSKLNEASEEKMLEILQYIQSNIFSPEKLRAEVISTHFGISETYLGRYFKKHADETLQQYITQYKLKLIENRLLHSNMRINEIAYEFGFTDKSHLNRMFKKYKGTNPSAFKRTYANVVSMLAA